MDGENERTTREEEASYARDLDVILTEYCLPMTLTIPEGGKD